MAKNNFIDALRKGIATTESEELRKMMGVSSQQPIKENLKSVSEIDTSRIRKDTENTRVLSFDVIKDLVSGKSINEIKQQKGNNLYVDTGFVSVSEYEGKINESKATKEKPENVSHINVKKDDIEEIIYDVLADLLDISKSKSNDIEYIKSMFADAVLFIKFRDSLKK